jgi:hypothetical protein
LVKIRKNILISGINTQKDSLKIGSNGKPAVHFNGESMEKVEKFDDIIGATLEDIIKASSTYVATEDDSKSVKVEGDFIFFDRGVLVIENPFMIINSKKEEIEIDKLIGDSVRTAYLSESEIRIIFESYAVLTISMRDEDFVGPEAASWNPNDGPIIVFN